MKCSNCGNEVPEGNAFCTSCGTPIEAQTSAQANSQAKTFCTNCGAEVPEGNAFCVSCGTPVDGAKAQEASAATAATAAAAATAKPSPSPAPASSAAPAQTQQQPVSAARPVQPQATKQMPVVPTGSAQAAQAGANGKNNTALIVGIIAAAVVLIVAIICVVVFVLGPNDAKNDQAQTNTTQASKTVPDVVNLNVTSATATLTSSGYTVKVNYADGKENVVLQQSPNAGTELAQGSEVLLTVGQGTNGTHEVELTVTNPRTNTSVSSMITLNANDEVIPDLLTKKYTRSEIEAMNLSDAELYIARNSIVAHQGYIFQYQPNTEFFTKNCSWYHPSTHEYSLNGIPSENATTILEIEKARNSWYPEIK